MARDSQSEAIVSKAKELTTLTTIVQQDWKDKLHRFNMQLKFLALFIALVGVCMMAQLAKAYIDTSCEDWPPHHCEKCCNNLGGGYEWEVSEDNKCWCIRG